MINYIYSFTAVLMIVKNMYLFVIILIIIKNVYKK